MANVEWNDFVSCSRSGIEVRSGFLLNGYALIRIRKDSKVSIRLVLTWLPRSSLDLADNASTIAVAASFFSICSGLPLGSGSQLRWQV